MADALYLNAPFINTLKENGLEGVIRLKDERRRLFQDAEGLFYRWGGEKEIIPIREKRQRYGICLVLRYPAARTVCEKHVTMKHRRKREGIRRCECSW